jgi:hypothetical protein
LITDFGKLILDAQNNTDAIWVFQTKTTIMTGSRSIIVLKNGAQFKNVFWAIGTAATMGPSSFFVGQILAVTAVTLGRNAILKGRAFARTSMTFNGGALVSQTVSENTVNMTIGSCDPFAVLAKTSVTFGQGNTTIAGSVGVSPGTSITGNYELSSGTTERNTAIAQACVYDLGTAYNLAATATCHYYLSNSELSGLTLSPGVYCSSSGLFTIAKLAFVTLDGLNMTNPVWIFQTTSTLDTGDDSSMILKDGALPKNVYWAVGTEASIGNSAFFVGNLMVQSSILYAPYAILDGRGLSFADVTFRGYSSAGTPNGTAEVVKPSIKINIGACERFAILAYNSIIFNSALTVISADSVGNSPGTSVSGNYQVTSGTTEINTAAANQCNDDFATAYDAANGKTCLNNFAAADISGKALFPGVYCSTPGTFTTTAFSTLTLDAQNDTNAVWIFQTRTTLITGSRSRVLLKNGAQYKNVIWAIGTAATLGSSSFFIGQILALTAVTLEKKSVLLGRIFAKTSLTVDSGSLVSQTASSTSIDMTIGSCSVFSVLAKTSITFGLGQTAFTNGSIGVSPGTSITGSYQLNSGTLESNSALAQSCAYDLGTAYNAASTATCEYYLSNSELSGLTLSPGVYCTSSGSFSLDKLALVTLDALNDINAVWVFQTTTNLDTYDFSSMMLINGALSKNVYWAVGAKVTLGYAAFFVGNIMAQSSIKHSSYTLIDGRMLSFTDVTFAGYSSLGLPNGPSEVITPKVQVYLGKCVDFAVMAGSTAGFNLALTVIHSGSIGNSPGNH